MSSDLDEWTRNLTWSEVNDRQKELDTALQLTREDYDHFLEGLEAVQKIKDRFSLFPNGSTCVMFPQDEEDGECHEVPVLGFRDATPDSLQLDVDYKEARSIRAVPGEDLFEAKEKAVEEAEQRAKDLGKYREGTPSCFFDSTDTSLHHPNYPATFICHYRDVRDGKTHLRVQEKFKRINLDVPWYWVDLPENSPNSFVLYLFWDKPTTNWSLKGQMATQFQFSDDIHWFVDEDSNDE